MWYDRAHRQWPALAAAVAPVRSLAVVVAAVVAHPQPWRGDGLFPEWLARRGEPASHRFLDPLEPASLEASTETNAESAPGFHLFTSACFNRRRKAGLRGAAACLLI